MSSSETRIATDDFNPADLVKKKEHEVLLHRVDSIEELLTVEGFSKVFCEKTDESLKVRNKLCDIIRSLLEKDEKAKTAIIKIINENEKNNIFSLAKKIGFVIYTFTVFVLGLIATGIVEYVFSKLS